MSGRIREFVLGEGGGKKSKLMRHLERTNTMEESKKMWEKEVCEKRLRNFARDLPTSLSQRERERERNRNTTGTVEGCRKWN